MATVFNTVVQPDGTPQAYARVRVEVSWNQFLGPIPKHDGLELFVTRSYGVVADSTGYWEVDLFPGSVLSPTGILYKITQRLENDQGERFYIDVPGTGGPFWVADILVPKPGWEN